MVVVVTEEFADLAGRLAHAAGRPGLPTLVLPYPLEDRPAEEVTALADAAYPRLTELLGATTAD